MSCSSLQRHAARGKWQEYAQRDVGSQLFSRHPPGQGRAGLFPVKCSQSLAGFPGRPGSYTRTKGKASLHCLGLSAVGEGVWAFLF